MESSIDHLERYAIEPRLTCHLSSVRIRRSERRCRIDCDLNEARRSSLYPDSDL